jgi:hypothetical protein
LAFGEVSGICENGNTVRFFAHAEAPKKSRFAGQDLRCLRAAFCVAKEVGEGMGGGQVLLGSLPERAEVISALDWEDAVFRVGDDGIKLSPEVGSEEAEVSRGKSFSTNPGSALLRVASSAA